MPYNGTGAFQALPPPAYPAVAGTVINASYFNAVINDILAGLSTAIAKDGQTTPSSNLPMGGRKHTGVADASGTGQYYAYGQDFPAQAADTSNAKPATTAFVLGQLSATLPIAVGTAAIGTSKRFARADHSHAMPSALVGQVVSGLWLTAPSGYLELAGQLVSRTTYAALWAHAQSLSGAGLLLSDFDWGNSAESSQVAFSTGNGSTTFRLPDYRGLVVRGWDHSRGLDAGRGLGNYQADAIQNITGSFGISSADTTDLATPTGAFARNGPDSNQWGADPKSPEAGITFDASRVVRTAAETRVKSVALMYCIQY